MDTTDSASSALDAIDTIAFKVGLKGYNVDEVDAFLERLSGEVRQLRDLVQQQRQQLRQAAERISQLDSRPGAAPQAVPSPSSAATSSATTEQVASMLALAQRFIEQAQQEAEAKAKELATAAQDRAREIVADARSRAEDEVNRLNGLKQRLSEDVDALTHQFRAERERISGVHAEFTKWVHSLHGAEPAAPATPAPAPAPTPSPRALDEPTTAVATTPSRPVNERPSAPPPAPPPSEQGSLGDVLPFESPARRDRS